MKKVIALALAVLMLATVAFAGTRADIAPGNKITISRDKVDGLKADGEISATMDDETVVVYGNDISGYIPRSLTSANYSVSNVKYKVGKNLVESVSINDTEERVEIKMAQDLTNTKTKNFEVSFKLKGKAKYTLKDGEQDSYNTAKGNKTEKEVADSGDKVTLPSMTISVIGTVGYGEVEVYLGTDNDEEIDSLDKLYNKVNDTDYSIDDILGENIFKFKRSTGDKANTADPKTPMPSAGSYTADAILTQEYGDALTMEARVYNGDALYFGIDYNPVKAIISRLAEADGDLDFYFFDEDKAFTTFNSNCKLYFNDADEDSFVYKVNDNGYLVPAGEYSDEDGCWVVKTRTLGQYVVSDIELDDSFVATGDNASETNPDTGANDVVGIAAALAAVALVSAAAVSLKK